MKTEGLEDYDETGFFIADLGMTSLLERLRNDFCVLFAGMSMKADGPRILNDRGIVELYRSENRDAWVSAYDQLRYRSGVMALCGIHEVKATARKAGIMSPNVAARPIVRCDMPDDPEYEFDQHQDYIYNLGSLNSITIWIPFQDTPEELGALKVIPGSHKWGLLDTKDDGTLKEKRPEEEFETVEVKFGWALVFSQFLVHKSGHNTTDHGVRFSAQIRFNDLAHPEYVERGWPVNEEISRKKLYADFDAEYRA